MEILIEDISPDGLQIQATEGDSWLQELVVETVGAGFESDDHVVLDVGLSSVEGNVTIDGSVAYSVHHACDRCLNPYQGKYSLRIHAVLAPLYESRRQARQQEGEEIELVKEDLDFGYYTGDRFDLGELVREQLLLAQPMKLLCHEECRGLCQHCGQDLNVVSCSCTESEGDPRWAALKKITISQT